MDCLGASAWENGEKRKKLQKQRISTLWASGGPFSTPEPHCVLLRLTPDFSRIQFRLRDTGEEQMANLPLVQWYFKFGILPDYPAAVFSWDLRYKLHAFSPGLPVIFSMRDELSVLLSSYLESSCLFYYLSLVHLELPLPLPSDRLIFSHEISGLWPIILIWSLTQKKTIT